MQQVTCSYRFKYFEFSGRLPVPCQWCGREEPFQHPLFYARMGFSPAGEAALVKNLLQLTLRAVTVHPNHTAGCRRDSAQPRREPVLTPLSITLILTARQIANSVPRQVANCLHRKMRPPGSPPSLLATPRNHDTANVHIDVFSPRPSLFFPN